MNGTDYINQFKNIFNLAYEVLLERGITLERPTLILQEFPLLEKNGITSRDFKTPYLNKEDQIGGNLYSWIHQSYSVLWEIKTAKNEITLYRKTIEKLGLRYATLLKMDKSVANSGAFNLSIAYAISEIAWERYQALKSNNECPSFNNFGKQKKDFVFCITKLILVDDENSTKVLYRFLKMFDKEVDISNFMG